MPLEIQNPEKYLDRTVQDWHRTTFGPFDKAMDIDLLGFCNSCSDPLYLLEASENPSKPLTVCRKVAKGLKIPLFLVLHANGEVTGGRFDHKPSIWLERLRLEEMIRDLRQEHNVKKHKQTRKPRQRLNKEAWIERRERRERLP